jgi:putative peptidoglycan lipid II flippase
MVNLLKHRLLSVFVSATGVSFVVQVVAFLRQLLIAAYFGLGRDFDSYVMVYAVATFTVFTFGMIFDSVAVPHLVRVREKYGLEAARALAASVFRISVALGGVASMLFLIAVPLLASIIATGFSVAERGGLAELAWYFLPWNLICVPYYAAAARHKMEWRFNRVFTAEIVVVVASIGALVIWHDNISCLPLAYAAGYGFGLLHLVVGAGLVWPNNGPRASSRGMLRNIAELFGANQSGSVASVADRHIQSFVPTGGIGAINYSAQLVTALSVLLTFREVFIVPLAQELDRTVKLERLLCGLTLVAIPLTGVVACFAPDIVTILFQRGRFDAAASVLTSEVFRIGAMGIVISALNAPLFRMFQILDRIHLINWIYAAIAISTLAFGYLFVVLLGFGVQGVAWMQLGAAIVGTTVTAYLVSRCGVELNWPRIARHMGFALVITIPAYVAAVIVSGLFQGSWARLIIGGSAYGLIICTFYFIARARFLAVVFGTAWTKPQPK